MWGHKIKPWKQKPRKSRLLSSTKREEDRIELKAAVNQKLRKLKLRKSRNVCNSNVDDVKVSIT